MKKAVKKYLTQLRENEEKGFSLVELIIVMAIMAILVGVVASQVIPYMEKSRQSKDQQQLSSLATDITASIASAAVTTKDVADCELNETNIKALAANAADGQKVVDEFVSLRDTTGNGTGTIAAAISNVKGKLKSKAATDSNQGKSKIFMSFDSKTSKLVIFMTKNGAVAGANINKLTVESE